MTESQNSMTFGRFFMFYDHFHFPGFPVSVGTLINIHTSELRAWSPETCTAVTFFFFPFPSAEMVSELFEVGLSKGKRIISLLKVLFHRHGSGVRQRRRRHT